ncbi:hypothetical protein C2857_006087 [Epichloe festucae Fl1]|uniref:Uncharacterized protein n=1 Tax=Epichloe festucae (strain Fl1) TaxID=877507 RepID=A0A7S9KLC2_EPIFF|nr:hypothetical protein C2857_006087 [Epichloe festucae Fl1]
MGSQTLTQTVPKTPESPFFTTSTPIVRRQGINSAETPSCTNGMPDRAIHFVRHSVWMGHEHAHLIKESTHSSLQRDSQTFCYFVTHHQLRLLLRAISEENLHNHLYTASTFLSSRCRPVFADPSPPFSKNTLEFCQYD